MNTFLSESDLSAQEQFRLFASEQLAPVAQSLESRQANLKYFLQKVGQAGLFAVSVPSEYGGRGGPFLHQVLLAEALAAQEPGLGLTLSAQATVIEILKRYGGDSQRSKYLPLLAQGELIGGFAYAESEARQPLQGVQTEVIAKGKTKSINGLKRSVVNGRIANLIIVLAAEKISDQTQPDEAQKLGLWLVDSSVDHSMKVIEQGPLIGFRSAYLDDVQFIKCPISPEDRLGGQTNNLPQEPDDAVKEQFEFAISVTKTILAGAALGLSERLLAEAANYARTNERNGEPLGQSQGVQWRLADIQVENSAGRLLTYRAAWSKDNQIENFVKYAAMCKSLTAKMARIHSAEALQVLGLAASAADSPMERLYRDSKMFELCQGTIDEEKVLLGRELGI